ncbi:MAG: TonB-dependent receptor, partial [Mucilaginibacter sp.]
VIMNCLRFSPPPHLVDLYRYLISNNKIEDIRHYHEKNLNLQTDKILKLIKEGSEGWEEFVPAEVAALIKERCLFGYPCAIEPAKDEPALKSGDIKTAMDNA